MNQKKIKVLFTIPNFDTAGSGKVVYDLVKNLDHSVFEPEICCFHDRGAFMHEIEKLNVKVHLFQFAISYRPFWSFPFRLLKVVRFFRNNRFDMIHSWHWSSDFSEPLAARMAGIPWIYTKKAMGWGNKAWRWRSRLSTNIITINSDMKAFFTNKVSKKVVSIPLGVDTRYYAPRSSKDEELCKELSISNNDFVIISVVNLIPVKGIELLIQAVLEIKKPNVKLFIVGNDQGAYAESLQKLAADAMSIQFLGKKMDVRPYHSIADLFVIPTLPPGEGLPVAPMEAMASGTIVIGSKVSGVKDILQEFPHCQFEPKSVESLQSCILKMMEMSESDRSKLSQEMRTRAVNEYSIENFIDRHSELYKRIIR